MFKRQSHNPRGPHQHAEAPWVRLLLLLLTCLTLAACVSTLDNPSQKADPKKALDSYVQLGLNYLQNNNRELARFHLNKALDIDDDYAPVHHGLALLYKIEGEPKRAEEHFKKAIREDSGFSMARNNYGSFLFEHERYDEAYQQFEKASEDLDYQRRDQALYNLGRTALKLGNQEKAEATLIHSLNINPDLTLSMVELAEIYVNKQDYPQAKRYLDMFTARSRQTPRSLLLGIKLEKIFGNQDKEASYVMQLKNLHPYSKEYLEYKKSLQ